VPKKSVHAAGRDTGRVVALRGLFREAVPAEDVARLVFVEETRTNLAYCRRYGRAPAGRRVGRAAARRAERDAAGGADPGGGRGCRPCCA